MEYLAEMPLVAFGYVSFDGLDPTLVEALLLVVNGVNNCPLCTAIHGEFARVAGVPAVEKLKQARTEPEFREVLREMEPDMPKHEDWGA